MLKLALYLELDFNGEYVMQPIFATQTASISELKNNPSALIKQSDGESIAILNHNKPVAYLVSSDVFERMMEAMDDMALSQTVNARINDGQIPIKVTLDDL
ncbi:type II toxin-antitoxin system Phd/YefM family antitoxin [Psychrobacter sp. FBL11]|uniref:Antitoxin n=1 Tax=Psychrobacter saeujeotis TaxID=3143436 RepID=A0ABU9X7U7_9GAMM|nr:type II toxin-antitoxin system Phd/YefM family antitoxin [uncultured Psychrobacter sp.]